MAIKLSDALQRVKAGIADLDTVDASPSFEISPSANRPLTAVVPLKDIVVADRIRQYLDSEKTASLAGSIERYGFRGVLWVRLIEGRYHLVAGGRRYTACQMAGIKEVPVEIWDISDAEAIQLELLENFQREDLNPIEETEGILRMLEVTLDLPRAEVISLLNWKSRQQRIKSNLAPADISIRSSNGARQKPHSPSELNESRWQVLEEVFGVIGKFSPESFRVNRLPLLSLPQPIIDAISTGKIEYSKARLISRVKDEEARNALLAQAIEQNLSREEITLSIQAIQTELEAAEPRAEQQEFRTRLGKVFKKLRLARLNSRSRKKAEKLLSELESLLSD